MRMRTLTLNLVAGLTLLVTAAHVAGQATNPRFGEWKLRSDAPAPSINIMTYEPYGDGGMRITVASTNARAQASEWGYVTMFDGAFHPVTGQENAQTSVEVVDDRSTRISNMRSGRVYQVIINTLSEDGNTINNEYVRLDENGKIERVTHAIYDRIR
jgi:hypothetical protein